MFDEHKITDLPVVDVAGTLVGIIRNDVLVSAAVAESSNDILTMVGANKDERAFSRPLFVVRKRLPWLQINLVTAFVAAAVVGLFEDTIARVTALAVLLPVVAGQSGNTGAQALAVTMRGLALHEIGTSHWRYVAIKEITAGFINGLAIALVTAVGVLLWSSSAGLALVIAIAMVISMVAAGFAGAFMRWSARFKSRLAQVEKAMGALLVVAGVLIFTGQMSAIANWLLETFPALAKMG